MTVRCDVLHSFSQSIETFCVTFKKKVLRINWRRQMLLQVFQIAPNVIKGGTKMVVK